MASNVEVVGLRISKSSIDTQRKPPIHRNAFPGACLVDIFDGEINCKLISNKRCFDRERYSSENFKHGWQRCVSFKQSCAVVGSSSHLLNSNMGGEIDDHEIVIRINGAPPGRGKNLHLSKDIGSRTDVRFLNQFGRLPNEEEGHLDSEAIGQCLFLTEVDIKKKKEEEITCRGRNQTGTLPKWSHVFIDDVNDQSFAQKLRSGDFDGCRTTGLIAISYALRTCEKVSLYGFGPTCQGESALKYYHQKIKNPVEAVFEGHKYDNELALLKYWSFRGFFLPSGLQPLVYTKTLTVNTPACWAKQSWWQNSSDQSWWQSWWQKDRIGFGDKETKRVTDVEVVQKHFLHNKDVGTHNVGSMGEKHRPEQIS